jgi:putative DNA primase/helicase
MNTTKNDGASLAKVVPRELAWLWPRRIALGKITLLAGDPGVGKSLLTLDIAARVSTGAPWPDEPRRGPSESPVTETAPNDPAPPRRPPGSVIVFSAEDDPSDTIRPRLVAHGADLERIYCVPYSGGLELERLGKQGVDVPEVRLVIIDPVSAYLGKARENSNTDVRAVLAPLVALATRHPLAVECVTHLSKREGAAIHRVIGSQAFVAAPRATWIVQKNPDRPAQRLFLPAKNNLAADVGGLAFTIEAVEREDMPIICWSRDEITLEADAAMAPAMEPHARAAPARARRDPLAARGPFRRANPGHLNLRGGDGAWIQLRHAATGKARARLPRAKKGFRDSAYWFCQLPGEDAQLQSE